MALEDIERIVEQSSNKLYQISSPPARYWLLTQVMDKDEHDAVLRDTLRQCESYLPKVKLLDKLRPYGTWPIPKRKKIAEDAGPGPPLAGHTGPSSGISTLWRSTGLPATKGM